MWSATADILLQKKQTAPQSHILACNSSEREAPLCKSSGDAISKLASFEEPPLWNPSIQLRNPLPELNKQGCDILFFPLTTINNSMDQVDKHTVKIREDQVLLKLCMY
ncbi:hypothetical protein QVD17_20034 [Tagetes erecta]|uniref:Uncharacterized protein n=1 Tax=Tagetes erecta TaxID=13708 RepID=A0AAD8NXT7_TARER|nr:hypothetical protein QVD17_20034 [Tagetes erecta]